MTSTADTSASQDLGIGKIAAVVGLPISTYLIQFADLELPHPLTPTIEDGIRVLVIGLLIWVVPHDFLSKLATLFTSALKAK